MVFRLADEEYKYHRLNDKMLHLVARTIKQHSNFFSFKVRVLLDEKKRTDTIPWIISCNHGFMIPTESSSTNKIINTRQTLNITIQNNTLYINDKKHVADSVLLFPRKGFIQFDGNYYQGCFLIVKKDSHVYLINQLDLEDYIYSVLRWESWPGWPIEVNKAFAIAIRSYLVAKVLQAHKQNNLFHIKNTNIHQTYNGVHTSIGLKRAISETYGYVLTYDKKPIEAMFDSCCGGIIPAHLSGINFSKAPYLARDYPCTFCKNSKIYSWQLDCSVDDFETILRNAGYYVKDIHDIKVIKKDRAGAPERVMIRDGDTTLHLTGKQMYSLLTKIKSFCYSIEKKGKQISFKGRGYGHHLGICQWGARRMIDAGWNYTAILQFYYPGTVIMQLKNGAMS
jgi:stage II sporulation protein D (peptidoglycan lytic transglycosylase)